MKFALFGKQLDPRFDEFFNAFLTKLASSGAGTCIYKPFLSGLSSRIVENIQNTEQFTGKESLDSCKPDYLISFGGDGTLLDAVSLTGKSGIPLLGINSGRLGFLSSIGIENSTEVIDEILKENYKTEKRTLLTFISDCDHFTDNNFALNEFTIHKRDTSAMLTIKAYLNNELLNTYWSDGLVIATPTGSTAYSLSCGGPVIFPDTRSFVITPVASHNISIRPVIVSDDTELSFKVEGRGRNFLISLDSRYAVVDYNCRLSVKKAPFHANFIKFPAQTFISTLREKLMLGIDNRNAYFF